MEAQADLLEKLGQAQVGRRFCLVTAATGLGPGTAPIIHGSGVSRHMFRCASLSRRELAADLGYEVTRCGYRPT